MKTVIIVTAFVLGAVGLLVAVGTVRLSIEIGRTFLGLFMEGEDDEQ